MESGARASHQLPPAGLRVRLAQDTMLGDGGRRLAGGHPFRLMRLTDQGAEHVRRWRHGAALGHGASERALARRLLDAALLTTIVTRASGDRPEIDVIVPVRDRPRELERCLASLAADGLQAVVVDDGSLQAQEIARTAGRHGAAVIRLPSNRGPAAARNAGLRATSRPLVAFVDQDVQVELGWLRSLLPHFADPAVALAAPRVRAAREEVTPGLLSGYEARHSSLDMGPHPADAGRGRRVPYVPSTAILVRRAAMGTGFDESLRVGEDVDLCWRLADHGWRVVYEPGAGVRHSHRTRLAEFIRTRWLYGNSVGALSKRHPGALGPLHASRLTLASILGCLSGDPLLMGAFEAMRAAQLYRHTRGEPELLLRLLARDYRATWLGLARAGRRVWSPLLLAAGARSSTARRLLALTVALALIDDDRPSPRDLPASLLDDLIAAGALWCSCAREHVVQPILPSLS